MGNALTASLRRANLNSQILHCSNSAPLETKNGEHSETKRRVPRSCKEERLPPQCKSFHYKADAERWAAETERAIETGQLFLGQDCTVGELLDRYEKEITPHKKCAPIERYRINRLKRRPIAAIYLSKLRSSDVARYRDERLEEVSASTCIRDVSLLSNALHIARQEWGFNIPRNPARNIRLPTVKTSRERRLVGVRRIV